MAGPTVRQLAKGTYAWLWPEGRWGATNCGVVVGDREALLVDTPWDLDAAFRLLFDLLPALRGARLTYAVNTHSDGDHWWGNWALPLATEIITAEAVLAEMRREPKPKLVSAVQRLCGLGASLPGRLGGCSRYLKEVFGTFRFAEVVLRYPDTIFCGELELDVGGRSVQLLELGGAHTACDVVVFVADVGVVFTGDLLFAGSTPVMWHGPLSAWLAALERLLQLPATLYVPGHGPPLDRGGVVELRDYLSFLAELLESSKEIEPARLPARLVSAEPAWGRWLYPERAAITALAERSWTANRKPFSGPLGRLPAFCHAAAARTALAG